MLPDHLAGPVVELVDRAAHATAADPVDSAPKQCAVLQQPRMLLDGFGPGSHPALRVRPVVHDVAVHVDQVSVTAAKRTEKRVARRRLGRIVLNQFGRYLKHRVGDSPAAKPRREDRQSRQRVLSCQHFASPVLERFSSIPQGIVPLFRLIIVERAP